MGQASTIEWTESTWNPLTGCTKISPGCKHCYAERMALRLQAMGQPNYANGFDLALHENALELPLKWKKPQTIFVNSMSDLFHKDVPVEFIVKTFDVMRRGDWHKFPSSHQAVGATAGTLADASLGAAHLDGRQRGEPEYTPRIDDLRRTGAMVKFLSLEPLLGPLPGLNLEGIDWVIVGGESGPGARPMDPAWVLEIRDQCLDARVPFFFKQWGGTRKKKRDVNSKAGRGMRCRQQALALAL